MKVSIVGAGIMGLGTAWALERLGHQVTVFEQGPVPNPKGSSVDRHRLIRYPYGAAEGYMRMVADAYAIWDQVWADLGETLYRPTGTLCLSRTGAERHRASIAALERAGHAVERLSEAELVRRFPLVNAGQVDAAYYLESGGLLFADRIVAALARRLAQRGVEIRPETPVAEIDPDRGFVTLADGTVVGADALVVAAGPWVARLVPGLGRRVKPSRQVVAYLNPPDDLMPLWQAGPMLLDIDPSEGFYAVPPREDAGLKVSDHRFSLSGDPDGDRAGTEAEVATALASCARRLKRFDEYRIDRLQACFYTVEPEEKFIIEPVGLSTYVMSPCSGHGFKFGPLLGSAVAGAINAGEPGDIAAWAAGAMQ
ncbi:FAD-dependent oxidoreductase [Aliidongia dinghuensis]|uniref:FAD-dependent oxidoreductase n=1 Tax=Aliidongia dinghuensis TaxID=1867774 RepID=A0A8J3E693_9PROT|nr:FAD-dependent oxidoreductase [Aliidongia dinghuensis]GGF41860.1 FAD-dependent oxidoreductase [Aliidongia dinghuensis]